MGDTGFWLGGRLLLRFQRPDQEEDDGVELHEAQSCYSRSRRVFRLLEKFLKCRFNLYASFFLNLEPSVSSPNFSFFSTLTSSLVWFFFSFHWPFWLNYDVKQRQKWTYSIFFYNHSEALQLLLNVPECTAVIFTHPSLCSSCCRHVHVSLEAFSKALMLIFPPDLWRKCTIVGSCFDSHRSICRLII